MAEMSKAGNESEDKWQRMNRRERMRSLIGAEELINKINDTYKGYMLEEQYSPLSFKNMVEELAEKATINAIPIPEGATNGEVVEEIFGKYIYYILILMMYSSCCEKLKKWWNSPYKGGCNLSEKPTGSESEDKE